MIHTHGVRATHHASWLLAAAIACFGATPALARDVAPQTPITAAFSAADMAPSLLNLTEPAVVKGIRRVAVPMFMVEFVTEDSVTGETSGFASAGRARASAHYRLVGVGAADFQAIADKLYADFLRDLKGMGLDVVTPEQLLASPAYRKLAEGGRPSPNVAGNSVAVAPAGLTMYGLMGNKTGAAGSGLFGALSGFSAVGAAFSSMGGTMDLQKELDATIMEVRMRVNFAELTNNNKGFLGRMSSTASVEGKVFASIAADTTQVLMQTGTGGGSLILKNTLVLDASAIPESVKAGKSGAEIAGGVAVALLSLAIGSKDSSSSSSYEARADAPQYRAVVGDGLGKVREMVMARIQAAR